MGRTERRHPEVPLDQSRPDRAALVPLCISAFKAYHSSSVATRSEHAIDFPPELLMFHVTGVSKMI